MSRLCHPHIVCRVGVSDTTDNEQHRIMSVSPFSAAHRRYVKSLYKRMLENERNWVVRYDFWRARARVVRAEFERNRSVVEHPLLLRLQR